MEREIYDKLLALETKNQLNKLYYEYSSNFDFPLKIDDLCFKTLVDFNNNYFSKYKCVILKNALVYILDNNINKFLKYFYESKDNFETIMNDTLFRAMITKYAFLNIRNKQHNIDFNENDIIAKNQDLFNKVINDIKIYNIFSIYRDIIISFLTKFEESDRELLLDELLFTSKYNNLIIKNNNYLNINNLENFKYIITKLILADTFMYLSNLDNDDEFFDDLFINDDELEEDEELLSYIDREILDYINLNIDNLSLPVDDEMRYSIYSKFIIYNLYIKEQKYEIKKIMDNTVAYKKLKKINPLYIIDLFNSDN